MFSFARFNSLLTISTTYISLIFKRERRVLVFNEKLCFKMYLHENKFCGYLTSIDILLLLLGFFNK